MTVTYNFNGLTSRQQQCLAYYALDGNTYAPVMWAKATTESLVRRGFLVQVDRNMSGGLTVHDYEMPISVHMAWCGWCSENVDEDVYEQN